jgi:transcriptional regulator with XRE-family HTH domain
MGASDTKWSRYDDFVDELSRHLDDASPMSVKSVGERIRGIRKARGISAEALAAEVGIGMDALVQIESNVVSPPLGTLMKLARYLGAEAGTLIGGEGEKSYCIVRKHERRQVQRVASAASRSSDYSYMSLVSEVKGRHMEAFLVKLAPQSSHQELSVHQGEEFIFVLDGSMSVRLGDSHEIVGAGDSVYFLSSVPHLVTAAEQEPALVLAVIYSGA